MTERTVEDRLRAEYFALLPDARRILEELEAEVRHCLLPLLNKLDKHEKLTVTSRIKDCESALGALRRRQEGAIFDPGRADKYSLKSLNDFAGVRVLAFPRSRWLEADCLLRQHSQFALWTSDPVRVRPNDVGAEPLAFKYYGYCSRNTALRAELQIAPMLIGLFWEVEHSAIYKPSPHLKGVLAGMDERTIKVYEALEDFESEFERLIRRDPLKERGKRKKRRRNACASELLASR
jgi:ppGpp synthetase/RelA/SpoT-type nucleotidyltranferase